MELYGCVANIQADSISYKRIANSVQVKHEIVTHNHPTNRASLKDVRHSITYTVGGVDQRNALISLIYLHFTIPLAGKNQAAGETKINTVLSCM